MKIKKIATILALTGILTISTSIFAFADQFNVISLGANLNNEQKETMLKYFNAKDGSYELITVNNKEEREALKGIAPLEQIGNKTISCAYVQPTKEGSGINVKTANLTWVTASMISNTLVTAGVNNANVIAAAPFEVSGTGALTGILKAFEDSTGEKLDPEKKELANKELVATGNIAKDPNVGQEKASAAINDMKTEVIKDKVKTEDGINNIINNVTNNYNISLTPEQEKELKNLMTEIGKQNYNYDEIKETLNNISKNIEEVLKNSGEAIKDSGFFSNMWESIKNFFNGSDENKNENSGIINDTNNEALGNNTVVTGTNNEIQENAQSNNEENSNDNENFFEKILNWIKGIFSSENSN